MKLFNEDHDQFRDMIKKFVTNEITPNAAEWENNREIPRELWKKLGDLGCLGFCYDEKYGGMNLDFLYSVVLEEELTKMINVALSKGLRVTDKLLSTQQHVRRLRTKIQESLEKTQS